MISRLIRTLLAGLLAGGLWFFVFSYSFNSVTGPLYYHPDISCSYSQSVDEACQEQQKAIIQRLTAENRDTVSREARERLEQSVLAGIAVSALTWFAAIRYKRERKVKRKNTEYTAITVKSLCLCGIIVAVGVTALVLPKIRQLATCDWTNGNQTLSGVRTMGELQEKCGDPEVSLQVTYPGLEQFRNRLEFYFPKKGLMVIVDLIPDKASAWYLDSHGVKLCKVDASTAFDEAFFSDPNPPPGVHFLPLAPFAMRWTGWPVTVQPQSFDKFSTGNGQTLEKVQPC